jgi:small subunit ribosomal protein S17
MAAEERNEQEAPEEALAEDAAAEAPEETSAEESATEEPEAEDVPAEEPAAEAAPAANTEPEPELTPKQRRKQERSRAGTEAKPPRTPAERAEERSRDRAARAAARRRARASARRRRGEARQGTPPRERRAGVRKVRQGVVKSAKPDKTITVQIEITRRHPSYEKIVRRTNTIHVHDERNQAQEGDIVRVVESRPLSRTKRWRLVEVLEKAR